MIVDDSRDADLAALFRRLVVRTPDLLGPSDCTALAEHLRDDSVSWELRVANVLGVLERVGDAPRTALPSS